MRPRHKAAENVLREGVAMRRRGPASMRPRHKAAENVPSPIHVLSLVVNSFNEAAA